MRYKRAFYPGRFQPFHNGHLYAIRYILTQVEEVVIGVTAAQYNYEPDNPFTAGERIEMIKLALGKLYTRTYVIPIENTASNLAWLRKVETLTPSFNVVYTNNQLVRILAEREGYQVEPIPQLDREKLSGKYIRKLIIRGESWEHLVPQSVAEYIKQIKADQRIIQLSRTEKIRKPEQ